jgi:hypothetical protein
MRWGVLLICIGLAALTSTAADWPQFRGNGTGVSSEKEIPSEWAADKNVLWKTRIPGVGWSQPIIVGDKVFVTTAVTENQRKPSSGGFGGGGGGGFGKGGPGGGGGGGGGGFGKGGSPPNAVYQFQLLCLDRTSGKIIWSETALESKPKIATHGSNTYATETPVTDGEHVYAYFGMHGVYCFDMKGKQVWKKDLGSYSMMAGWGTGSSPVLVDDRLIIQCDNEEKSFIIALDKKDGKELWRIARNERSTWCSPIVWKNKQRTELVAIGSKVRSYDPADGKLLWELNIGGGQYSVSPGADDEMLYVGSGGGGMGGGGFGKGGPGGTGGGGGFGKGGPGGMGGGGGALYAVKVGGKGDITPKSGETKSEGVAWSEAKSGLGMASPLVYKGHVYVLERNGGLISCFDAKTGKAAYTKERITGARAFWASPVAIDDKVYCLDDDGNTFVVQAGPEFKQVGKNSIKEMFWSSPAIADGAIFLRGVDNLYCIKK